MGGTLSEALKQGLDACKCTLNAAGVVFMRSLDRNLNDGRQERKRKTARVVDPVAKARRRGDAPADFRLGFMR